VDETSEPESEAAVEVDTPAEHLTVDETVPRPGVSRTVLIVSVLAAALVAGVAGVIIGWKVEQQRVEDDLANIRPIGTVTAVDEDSVTIELQTASGSKTYEITDRTTVDGGELAEGSTVLIRSWRGGGDGQLQVNKIVVLGDEPPAEDAEE
jgi:hypothetical protein